MTKPTHKPRGRPPVPEPSRGARVTTWLKPDQYNKLHRLASARDESISSLVRSLLRLKL